MPTLTWREVGHERGTVGEQQHPKARIVGSNSDKKQETGNTQPSKKVDTAGVDPTDAHIGLVFSSKLYQLIMNHPLRGVNG